MIDSFGNGAAVGADPAAPADQVLAAAVRRHRLAAQFGGQRDDGVLRRPDERAAEIDRDARDRRRVRPAADAIAALEHHDVVPEPCQSRAADSPANPAPTTTTSGHCAGIVRHRD